MLAQMILISVYQRKSAVKGFDFLHVSRVDPGERVGRFWFWLWFPLTFAKLTTTIWPPLECLNVSK